jgi:hypothetical protein
MNDTSMTADINERIVILDMVAVWVEFEMCAYFIGKNDYSQRIYCLSSYEKNSKYGFIQRVIRPDGCPPARPLRHFRTSCTPATPPTSHPAPPASAPKAD